MKQFHKEISLANKLFNEENLNEALAKYEHALFTAKSSFSKRDFEKIFEDIVEQLLEKSKFSKKGRFSALCKCESLTAIEKYGAYPRARAKVYNEMGLFFKSTNIVASESYFTKGIKIASLAEDLPLKSTLELNLALLYEEGNK